MRRTPSFVFFLLAILALAGIRTHAQANINENQKTYLYVDAGKGSDGNSGASNLPFKTIQAAVNKAVTNIKNKIGTKVVINAGVYRETVTIPAVQTGVPLTVEASTTGTAIIAGSNVLTGWDRDAGSTAIYTHSWIYNFGECAVPSGWPPSFAPVALRTEMIFVNSVPLTQVMSYGDLRPGTFYVNEAADAIHVAPAANTNMATAVVEAAVRSQTLNMEGASNVVLRGLVLRHAATCINGSGATITNSTNVLLDHMQALWNNWGGLAINSSTDITVQNSIASYNGGVGLQANKDTNSLYSFNETDYNNWRGAQGAIYDWGMGGIKLMEMRTATVQDHYSYRNQAQGLWFDTDNQNVTINNATLAGNVMAAFQIERNEGPVVVENSTVCSSGVGINVLTSEKLTIKDNVFYNNGGTNKYQSEIFIGGTNGGQTITNWQTGASYDLFTTGTVLTGNTFEDASSGQDVFGTYLSGNDWTKFADSLDASSNRWYDPNTTSAFKIEDGKFVTLSGWQSATGTDYSSDWALPVTSPVTACGIPTPSMTDFSVIANSDAYTMSGGQAVSTLRVNSFGFGTVALSVSGLPTGVSGSLSSTSLVSGVVTLTLKAGKTAATANVPITVWATGSNRVHSVTFYVKVAP